MGRSAPGSATESACADILTRQQARFSARNLITWEESADSTVARAAPALPSGAWGHGHMHSSRGELRHPATTPGWEARVADGRRLPTPLSSQEQSDCVDPAPD
jgi:hypothetical protein